MSATQGAHVYGIAAYAAQPQKMWMKLAALVLVLMTASAGSAQDSQPESKKDPVGVSSTGLRGLDRIGMPIGEEGISVAGTAGFGYLESMGSVKGSHQSYAGRLAIGAHIIEGLSASLMFDGHYDRHPDDGMGKDSSAVGDPQIMARYGLRLNPDMQLGFEAGFRAPGSKAPSVKLSASTVDLKALLALLQLRPLSIHVLAGFRMNNSYKAAPDLNRIREGDRISLGMSSGHQVLAGLGAHYAVSKTLGTYLEATADPILRKGVLSASPMRVAIGGRYTVAPGLLLEATITGALNKRPDLSPNAPLVPIEPRVQVALGLRYSFLQPEPPPKAPPVVEAPPPPVEEEAPVETSAALQGLVMDEYGAPLAGARVQLSCGETVFEATTDENGAYNFEEVPYGQISVEVSKEGYASADWRLLFDADAAGQQVPASLKKTEPLGQLRGLVRSFKSEPLSATVDVRDKKNKPVTSVETDSDGRFQVDLKEGTYRVKVTADGYRPQKRKIVVRERGVTILNLDLRSK